MTTVRRWAPRFVALHAQGVAGQVICECQDSFGRELYIVEEKGHPESIHAVAINSGGWYFLSHAEFGKRRVLDHKAQCPKCGHWPED